MKPRSFFSALALVVVVLLVVGIGGFWGITSRNPSALIQQGGQAIPVGTAFVPKQSPLVVSVLVRPDRLASLWQFLSDPARRRQTESEIERLERSFLAGTGVSYERDLQPWLGDELTFAVTTPDLDRDSTTGLQPGYLLVMSCKDSESARQVLELFWQKRAIAGENLNFEQFAGSRLIYTQVSGKAALAQATPHPLPQASALVGERFVLLASDPTVLRQAIGSAQAKDLNLGQDPRYQEALASLPKNRVGVVMVNLPQSLAWLGTTDAEKAALPVTHIEATDGIIDRAVFSLRLHRQGLLADTALLAAAGHRFRAAQSTATAIPEAARFLTEAMPLVATSWNLNQLWQSFAPQLAVYGQIAKPLQQLSDRLQNQLGDVPLAALLDWSGEYAVGMVPKTTGLGADWLFVGQSPRDQGADLADLDEVARQQGLSLGSLDLQGQPVMAWTKLRISSRGTASNPDFEVTTDVQALHAKVDSYELFATSLRALAMALQTPTALLQSSRWQAAIEPLNPSNRGYLYLDWPALKPVILRQVPWFRLVETVGQPILSHLKSVTVSGYRPTEQMQLGGIFLRLSNS